jgi:hypothetical protein
VLPVDWMISHNRVSRAKEQESFLLISRLPSAVERGAVGKDARRSAGVEEQNIV